MCVCDMLTKDLHSVKHKRQSSTIIISCHLHHLLMQALSQRGTHIHYCIDKWDSLFSYLYSSDPVRDIWPLHLTHL